MTQDFDHTLNIGLAMVRLIQQGLAAIIFYTVLPIPHPWTGNVQFVSRFAPLVGILIAGMLSLADAGLRWVAMPDLMRCVVIVLLWIAITGGLHLDGAMDTADGLAVLDPERRLEVMADSRTGAFGVMAAIALLSLKMAALATLQQPLWWALLLAAGWGRWGQQVAIALYPYLKPSGKGAFHKEAISSWYGVLPGLGVMLIIALGPRFGWPDVGYGLLPGLGGGAIALLTAAWFNHRLGGHTGDTYGAVVEWTEALTLLLGTLP